MEINSAINIKRQKIVTRRLRSNNNFKLSNDSLSYVYEKMCRIFEITSRSNDVLSRQVRTVDLQL